jgi:hypothetical protein
LAPVDVPASPPAFQLTLTAPDYDTLEPLRVRLMHHLRELKFSHLYVLRDDASKHIATLLYPTLYEAHNLVRAYLTRFLLTKLGPEGLTRTVKGAEWVLNNSLTECVRTELLGRSFGQLGDLVMRPSSPPRDPGYLLDRLLAVNSLEELEALKQDAQGSLARHLRALFADSGFAEVWQRLAELRSAVARSALFAPDDQVLAEKLLAVVRERVDNALAHIHEAEPEGNGLDGPAEHHSGYTLEDRETLPGLKVVGKIDLGNDKRYDRGPDPRMHPDPRMMDTRMGHGNSRMMDTRGGGMGMDHSPMYSTMHSEMDRQPYRIVTEAELMSELATLEEENANSHFAFIGLRFFVTNYLARKGYSIGPTYALINILYDEGKVELYDVENPNGPFPVKAVRTMQHRFM